jgi:hypothetical protein
VPGELPEPPFGHVQDEQPTVRRRRTWRAADELRDAIKVLKAGMEEEGHSKPFVEVAKIPGIPEPCHMVLFSGDKPGDENGKSA